MIIKKKYNINVDLSSSDEEESPYSSLTSVTNDADQSSDLDDPPMAEHPALATSEYVKVANFVRSRSLSADFRYNLLKNHFKPGVNYSFPKSTSTRRSFQYWCLTVSLACIQ